MDRSPALLLLLTLGLCEYGHGVVQPLHCWGQFRNTITQLRVGQRLELECETDRDSGAFWIRQDKSGTLHFIVFISSISRATFQGNERTSTRFEASKDNKIYRLVVKSLTAQDEGKYFCTMNINQMLFFSPGQPVFLPVEPTTPEPTTPGPPTQSGITEKDSCLKMPDLERRMQEKLNSFCLIFIWVPLTGLCLLLLQLLVTTIVLWQQS
ncbi:CD8A protein, partial [Ptilonorhynchus violaceus]|nr:CD8A protein [Ptilonorhynchus violaceus]